MGEADRGEIIDIINLYALAVDTQRWSLFDQVFTPDAVTDYPPALGWTDLESFKRDFAIIHDPLDGTMHVMSNHQVRVTGDEAVALTYGHWRLMRQIPIGGGDFWEGGGWYDDHLVRTAGGWRIDRRKATVCWWGGNPLAPAPLPGNKPVEQTKLSMRSEADAGRIGYVAAVAGA